MRRSSVVLWSALLLTGSIHAMAMDAEVDCAHAHVGFAPAPFDDATGANPDHIPALQQVDIEHIRLEMDFPGLETKSASVVETIIFNAPWEPRSDLTLDASGLDIQGIERLDDSALSITQSPEVKEFGTREGLEFFTTDDKLHIHFPTMIAQGERAAIRIRYTIHDCRDGLFWMEPLPGDPDPRWEVWSQGEAESNRHWFASHDYPNDRFTSEIIARVPQPNVVSAAGTLVARRDNDDGSATFHWRMEQSHVNYLVTLVIGQFDVRREDFNGVQLEYYVPPQRAADSERSFAKTKEMMATFSRLFDEPFPYPRYAQIVVRDFSAGGMENVTATTLAQRAIVGEACAKYAAQCNGRAESLIAHELAHSWFGDLITCRNWSHLWLNEGWASYAQALWAEASCGREEYEYGIWNRRRDVAGTDPLDSKQPLVFRRPTNAEEMFDFNESAVYTKGGFILHMLRRKLGDEAFWKGTRAYIDAHKNQVVETDQFRTALESASGVDLEAFFRQWCERPGTPPVQVSLDYDARSRQAIITVEQTGKLSDESPAFSGTMKFFLKSQSGEVLERTFDVFQRKHTFSIPLDRMPSAFAADPDAAFLMDLTLKAPTNVLRDSMRSAPTVIGRCDAIHAYARTAGGMAVGPLREIVADAELFHGDRVEAALALGSISDNVAAAALVALAKEMNAKAPEETDWRVREAIAKALGAHKGADVTATLVALLGDRSEPVAAAAAASLGTTSDAESEQALLRAMERRGENERIAIAAMGALAKRRSDAALPAIIALTGPDVSHYGNRVRAVNTLAELLEDRNAQENSDAARRVMELATGEPRRQVRLAAIRATGRAKLKPAIPMLQQLAGKADDEALATAAKNAITAINDKSGTREDVKALEEKLNALESRINTMQKERGSASPPSGKRRRFLGIF
ncbi:MAG TPA: M1 family aminopeptidase [Candidatus Sumerlaeota bacterium]|nr:M1 family aminopeptidase [Candidatus Sumerlaeota bacterium]